MALLDVNALVALAWDTHVHHEAVALWFDQRLARGRREKAALRWGGYAPRALRVMAELQLDAVLLAPSGPNVDRARTWLAQATDVLRSGGSRD